MYSLAGIILRKVIGRLIVGILLIIGGIIYGVTSHSVAYQQSTSKSYHLHVLVDGPYMFQADDTGNFYIIDPADFTPRPAQKDLEGSGSLSILYKNDREDVKYKALDGTNVSGTGYRVEKFETADENGQNNHVFKNAEYIQHPNGVYVNNWFWGGGVALAGLLLFLATLLWPVIMGSRAKSRGNFVNNQGQGNFSAPFGNTMSANPYDLSANVPKPYSPPQQAILDPYARPQQPPAEGNPYR